MNFINFLTIAVVPGIVVFIILVGVREKKNVFDLFNEGAVDGLKLMFKLFPTFLRIIFCC